MRRLHSAFAQHRLLGGAMVLAVTQSLASVVGLLRDRLLTQTFPDLDVVDVYIAAFRPSDLLFQVTIMAGFSVALVPLLSRYHADRDTRAMSSLLSGVTGAAALLFGCFALIGSVVFPWIAPSLTQFRGDALDLYVQFGRLALLTNFLFVLGNAFGQYLITIQRYWIYGLTPVLYTLGTIVGTLLLTPHFGPFGPMLGTLIGAIVYVALRFLAVLGAGYRPVFRLWHPDLRELGLLMWPRMLALGALQLQLLLFDALASGLESGAVTVNAYARNFQSVVIGVVGIALAQSAFSPLSQAAARGERNRFWVYVRKGSTILVASTVPAAALLVFAAPIAATLVHLEGVFPLFRLSLLLYALSIPFECLSHLLLRAFYALKNTLTPSIMTAVSGVLGIAVATIFVDRFGVLSLALGYASAQVALLIGLAVMLPRSAKAVQ